MDGDKNAETVASLLTDIITNIFYSKSEDGLMKLQYSSNGSEDKIRELLSMAVPGTYCTDVIFTLNTDNIFFGVTVNPVITAKDALTLLLTEEPVKLTKFAVEMDSKLFDSDLTPEEIAAYILYEVTHYLSADAIVAARAVLDLNLLSNDDVMDLRNSANYTQLIIYALKDTLYKVSSSIFKEELEIEDHYIADALESAVRKIRNSAFSSTETLIDAKTYILKWVLTMYKNMKLNSGIIKDTLIDAKQFTASKLIKQEIDKTLAAIDRINAQTIMENKSITSEFDRVGFASLNEASLFKSLKTNGLRAIEDSLYEFAIRIKTCSSEEEALDILHGINTRIAILEDYLYNNPDLPDPERERWSSALAQYRKLRETLSNKKMVSKKYNIFFDYDQLQFAQDPQD